MIGKIKHEDIKNFDESNEEGLNKIMELYRELEKFTDYVEMSFGRADFKLKKYKTWFIAEIDVLREFIETRNVTR